MGRAVGLEIDSVIKLVAFDIMVVGIDEMCAYCCVDMMLLKGV